MNHSSKKPLEETGHLLHLSIVLLQGLLGSLCAMCSFHRPFSITKYVEHKNNHLYYGKFSRILPDILDVSLSIL